MSEERLWQAVAGRDVEFDGKFVYAVRSTGVYCRPSCPSRRPGRQQVVFFDVPDDAERAGFRPCRRCDPRRAADQDPDAALVKAACLTIEAEPGALPLEVLAGRLGVSERKLRGVFRRWLGISPRQFGDARRIEAFREQIRDGRPVTHALYEAGYGSSSRLYERATAQLGMTPATYRKGGRGMAITYGTVACPLGRLLVARTEHGICAVCLGADDAELEAALRSQYPHAAITRDDGAVQEWMAAIETHLQGGPLKADLPLDIVATGFQRRVWEELRRIPYGATRSYSEIGQAIGQPDASRAVANACASNPVALIVPCHRVVRNDGVRGGYRWGADRKERLLETEAECSRKNSG